MEQQKENIEIQEEKKKSLFLRFLLFIKKVISWSIKIGFSLLVFIILFFVAYQIKPIRQQLNYVIIKIVNSQLQGKIDFDDFAFKNWDRIEIEKLKLFADGDTVISGDKIMIDVSIKSLFSDTIIVNKIELDNIRLKVLRNRFDKNWNVNKIANPSEKSQDPPKPPTDFFIKLNDLNLVNSSFYLIDSNNTHRTDGIIDYSNMQLGKLNIHLSAFANLNGPDISSVIKNLSFNEIVTNTICEKLTANAGINRGGARLDSLLIIAPNHLLRANLRVDSMNVFSSIGDKELRNFLYTVDLKGEEINPKFVQKFAKIPLNLGETYTINANIHGTLEDLKVNYLNYKTRNTDLKLKGRLVKIIDTDLAKYDVNIYNSIVNDIDLTRILKDIKLENIPEFGNTEIDCHVIGSYDSAYVDFKVNSTKVGAVEGDAGLKFSSPNWYFANLKMQKMNLSTIIRNSGISSDLSGIAIIKGKEFNPKNMQTDLYLNVDAGSIMDYSFSDLKIKTKITNGNIQIDTFVVKQNKFSDSLYTLNDNDKYLKINGYINPFIKNPDYKFNISINRINLAEFLKQSTLPVNFKGDIVLSGSNFLLNRINLNCQTKMQECDFSDRSLFPFNFDMDLKTEEKFRDFRFDSKFLKLNINGNYDIDNLVALGENQGMYLVDYINKKINSISPDFDSTNKVVHLKKISKYIPAEINIKAQILDLSPITPFLGDLKLHVEADLDLSLKSTDNNTSFDLNKLKIDELSIKKDSFNFQILPSDIPLIIFSSLNLPLIDSLPKLTDLKLSIIGDSNKIDLNNLIINDPGLSINYKNDTAQFRTKAKINDIFSVAALGSLNFDTTKLNIIIDSTKLIYENRFEWNNKGAINSEISKNGFRVRSFILDRKGAESIRIRGLLANNDSNRIGLTIYKFPLNQISSFVPANSVQFLENIEGSLDSLSLRLRGSFNNPDIRFDLAFKDLVINNVKIEKASNNYRYSNLNILGNTDFIIKDKSEIKIDVKEFPIDLSLKSIKERFFPDKQINAQVSLNDFPLEISNGLIPAIKDFKGKLNSKIDLFGFLPDKIDYKGSLNIENGSFNLEPTNMNYDISGKIDVIKDSIDIKSITLKNKQSDLPNGQANVYGSIKMDNFIPNYLDFNVKAKEFMVLNNNSQKSLPDIYGDFIIGSGVKPIRFHGTLTEPNLDGDVNVIYANLNLPQTESSTKIKTRVKYERIGNDYKVQAIKNDSIAPISKRKLETSFADLINYDLWIKIMNRFIVNMDLGVIGKLNTEIETQNKNVPLHYTYNRYTKDRLLNGKLVVKDGSTLNSFYKTFKTTGSVNFPTGALDNPGLDLVAEYSGQSTLKNSQRNFLVKMYITGNREKPNIRFDYWLEGEQAKGDSTRILQDAMLLIAFGRTRTELVDSSTTGFNPAADLGTSGLSNLLSQSFTQLLQGTGVVQSADIDLSGGSWDKAKLKVSGQLLGNIVWRVGGTMSDFNNSNEFSIDIPLPYVLHPELLNNIIIQLTKQTNNVNTINTNQKEWEVKFQFGGIW